MSGCAGAFTDRKVGEVLTQNNGQSGYLALVGGKVIDGSVAFTMAGPC